MQLYEVIPTPQGATNWVEASHMWGLPGVICSLCSATWGITGIAYPSVDLSGMAFQERYQGSWPVSLDKLEELRRPIANLVPENLPLPPGTQFGPLVGKAEGPFEDIVWNGYWDILVKTSVLDRMRSIGVRLPAGVRPLLKFNGKEEDLLELQIDPQPKMITPPDSPPICPACGRWPITRPAEIIIDGSSISEDVDIFRVINFPTIILSTDRFVEVVRNLNLTGVVFEPVKVKAPSLQDKK